MQGTAVLGLVFLLFQSPLRAANAAFSDDGNRVYALASEKGIEVVDVHTGVIQTVEIPGVKHPEGICRAGDGDFYIVDEKRLWRWDPASKEPVVEVENAPSEKHSFSDVACNPKTDEVVIVGDLKDDHDDRHCKLFYKPDAGRAAIEMWLRHLDDTEIESPEFLPDGTLLFSAEGDLWHGRLGLQTKEKPDDFYGEIAGYRYAPLAERYTYSGTPSQMGVISIAYGAGRVFVHLHRMGGSGWGHVDSVIAPKPDKGEELTRHNKPEDSIRVLKSVKHHLDNGSCSYLCASPDRRQVYLTDMSGPERTHYLIDARFNRGEPVAFRRGDKILEK